MRDVHPAAAVGFQRAPEEYERGRPEYPAAAMNLLVRELGIVPGSWVADLGAGTGKLTRLLPPYGARVIAVEPVEGMRRKLGSILPEIPVVEGTAENLPLPDNSMDALLVGQAFHWFDGERALPEIHRVLKPGGRLGLVWNVRDESVTWVEGITRIFEPYEPGVPRYRTGEWRRAFDRSSLFSSLQQERFRWVQNCTPDEVLDRVASTSIVASLAVSERSSVLEAVAALLESDPLTSGKHRVEFPHYTDVYWCQAASFDS